MTSHLNSHRTTDIEPEMLSAVQTGNGTPHDKYNICRIAHAQTNRKYDIFMQRRLVQNFTFILDWGQGTCSLTKHTWRWAYSRYFSPACCLLRFAAFFFMISLLTQLNFNLKGFNELDFFKISSGLLQDYCQTNSIQLSLNSTQFQLKL